MGLIKKIPYLKEVIIYLVWYFIFFVSLSYAFKYLKIYNTLLLVTTCMFLAFSMRINYKIFYVAGYTIFYYIIGIFSGEFIVVFIYLLNSLINTLVIMVHIKNDLLSVEEGLIQHSS